MRRSVAVALALVALMPAVGAAQAKPGAPRARNPLRTELDTTRRDTTQRDTTSGFSAPDSLMATLLARPDFMITRYEGEVVTFDANSKALAIAASGERPAMVERDGLRVRTDSTIVYSDARQNVNVTGRYEIVPGAGQQPIAGVGTVQYDVEARAGRLTNATVTVDETGERWFISSKIGKTALGDSTRKIPPRFYGLAGTLTSCDDSIPDYHFRMQEIKRTEKNLVARPAVLYIKDIPVMWLPFVFQDIRPGRRSGVLPPRLGASDIVRNNPNYRRHIENIGYYWAMSDYSDLAAWGDWRSGAGGTNSLDPGWWQLNAQSNYRWNDRFLNGLFAFSYMKENTGSTRHSMSWRHSQQLGKDRNFNADANYTSSTVLQRRNTFDPSQVMGTIRSNVNYQDKIGPASLTVGASQTQYPGRTQIERTMPSVTLSSAPIALGKALTWTPKFEFRENSQLKIDQALPLGTRVVADAAGNLTRIDTLRPDRRERTMSIGTPFTIFGFELNNNFVVTDELKDYPEELQFYRNADSSQKELRIYPQVYKTAIDWNPTFTLPMPAFLQQRFKVTPSVSLQNVDGGPFWIRNQFTGGKYVHQSKRLSYGVATSPTIFGLFPGFGPFQRLRHRLSPTISYSYAPAADISTEYLEAFGKSRDVYLGALAQNSISFGLNQDIEAKVRSTGDTTAGSDKVTLLTMGLSSVQYDFERARYTGRRLAGITTENMSVNLRSDLIPGFDLSVGYSLFEGSTQTDTARFDPHLSTISSRISLSRGENPFAVIARLFGRAVPDRNPVPQPAPGQSAAETQFEQQVRSRPIAGQASRGQQFLVAPQEGWSVNLNLSSSRPRMLRGDRVISFDSRTQCEQYKHLNFIAYEQCLARPVDEPIPGTPGGVAVQMPNQTSMQGDFRFALTQHWAASWNTSYDFELHKFAAHVVSLQRDLHDWRAIFAFTHSPNGNFAFNFFISLKPQPELKFDYSRATVRSR